jgi:hypothetical protein
VVLAGVVRARRVVCGWCAKKVCITTEDMFYMHNYTSPVRPYAARRCPNSHKDSNVYGRWPVTPTGPEAALVFPLRASQAKWWVQCAPKDSDRLSAAWEADVARELDALEEAYKAEHPEVDWDLNEVTFDMRWDDKTKPPVFTANGWVERIDLAEHKAALDAANAAIKGGRGNTGA